jgi:glycosyltransferase involved in cell wall biosynthesis
MLEPWAIAYKSWKKKAYYSLFEKSALQKASIIRALVTSEALHIQELNLRTPLAITPNGITQQPNLNPAEVEVFYEQFPSARGKTLILFLGRIDPKKGLDLLATAFGQVHQQFPETHLMVAGPDNIGFLPTVQSYFERENCLHAVTFTGMLMGAAKAAALTVADLYVAPSYSEGFSMSVLEGMGAGLPCIITTGCNFPEAAAAEVAHVVEIDAWAIAQAMMDCLKHPQAAKAMGDRARQFIFENYTWDQIASRLIQVYNDILRGGAKSKSPVKVMAHRR